MGVNLEGQLVEIDLQEPETCHGLVVGMTGSGKTEWLYSVIAFVISNYLPVQVKLVLIDPKRSKFSKFEGIPWLLRPILKDTECGTSRTSRTIAEKLRTAAEQGWNVENISERSEHFMG